MNSLLEMIEIFKKNARLAESTINSYSSALNKFTLYLSAQMNIEKDEIYLEKVYLLKDSFGIPIRYLPINSSLIDDYFYSLIPKGPYTIHNHYSALMSFFNFIENNYNLTNPMLEMEFCQSDYTPEKKYSRIFTRGEIIKFFNSIISNSKNLETDLLLFSLLLTTGCRISEILGLQCQDIDFDNDTFLFRNTKNRHQRIINLRPNMGKIIFNYISQKERKKSDYLFLKSKTNQKCNRNDVDKLLKEYLFLANLPPINVHAFRHTFATLMADEDVPILFIQQMLGHENISATEGYINPHYVRNKNFNMPENQQVLKALKEKIGIKKL